MNDDQIDCLLGSLEPDDVHGWQAPIPREIAAFRDVPLRLSIGTSNAENRAAEAVAPAPNGEELALARRVLRDLTTVLGQVQVEFAKEEAQERAAIEKSPKPIEVPPIEDPHLWIEREFVQEAVAEGRLPERWTFVIGRAGWPDFGYHLEFEGTTFDELWAGD
ncbi:hypothetical protein [Alienimonas californiensis]|uniref:Uncharacterized protein n=1 Tax=Alienimonas californiensis TaxID=2527989 RepID=A0A517P3T0_9PLAN|nr:hypothetical protein [Alienimonas californiensis]QDT14030.1 hypothetical protein CA12_00980 [Alienimonas californiensis]